MPNHPDNHRLARLVFLDTHGTVIGESPELHLDVPWLQETGALCTYAADHWGLDIAVLRLIDADDSGAPALKVRYVAQLLSKPDALPELSPIDWQDEPDFHRPAYARAGGPADDIAWASSVINEAGYGDVISRYQPRSWNLSTIWRFDAAAKTFWLKHVPDFFAHESSMIQLLPAGFGPSLVTASGNRMLFEDVPGEDTYDANIDQVLHMVTRLVDLQASWIDRTDDLLSVGVPDFRREPLLDGILDALEKNLEDVPEEHRDTLVSFVGDLPDRLDALDDCGMSPTLVHGDFHPGNWRGTALNLIMLDWGDSVLGHPLFDVPPLLRARPEDERQIIADHWCAQWRRYLPEANVERALELTMPIACARMGAIYQMFLENIEVAERVYHVADPVDMFVKTAEILENGAP